MMFPSLPTQGRVRGKPTLLCEALAGIRTPDKMHGPLRVTLITWGSLADLLWLCPGGGAGQRAGQTRRKVSTNWLGQKDLPLRQSGHLKGPCRASCAAAPAQQQLYCNRALYRFYQGDQASAGSLHSFLHLTVALWKSTCASHRLATQGQRQCIPRVVRRYYWHPSCDSK